MYCENCTKFVYLVVVLDPSTPFKQGVHAIFDNLNSAILFIYKNSYHTYSDNLQYDFCIEKRILNDVKNYYIHDYIFDIIPKKFKIKITKEMWDRVIEEYPDKTYLNSLVK